MVIITSIAIYIRSRIRHVLQFSGSALVNTDRVHLIKVLTMFLSLMFSTSLFDRQDIAADHKRKIRRTNLKTDY